MEQFIIVFIILIFGYLVVKRTANLFYNSENMKKHYNKKYDFTQSKEELNNKK
ncbi:MAG: hypothetical protein ACOWWH_12845 [Eubacteriaceae bacterium]